MTAQNTQTQAQTTVQTTVTTTPAQPQAQQQVPQVVVDPVLWKEMKVGRPGFVVIALLETDHPLFKRYSTAADRGSEIAANNGFKKNVFAKAAARMDRVISDRSTAQTEYMYGVCLSLQRGREGDFRGMTGSAREYVTMATNERPYTEWLNELEGGDRPAVGRICSFPRSFYLEAKDPAFHFGGNRMLCVVKLQDVQWKSERLPDQEISAMMLRYMGYGTTSSSDDVNKEKKDENKQQPTVIAAQPQQPQQQGQAPVVVAETQTTDTSRTTVGPDGTMRTTTQHTETAQAAPAAKVDQAMQQAVPPAPATVAQQPQGNRQERRAAEHGGKKAEHAQVEVKVEKKDDTQATQSA